MHKAENGFEAPAIEPLTREGVYVAPFCSISPEAQLARGVTIEEYVHIGPGVEVKEESIIRANTILGAGVRIGAGSVVGGGRIEVCPGAQIGSHVRCMGSLLYAMRDPGGPISERETSEEAPRVEDGAFVGWGAMIIGGVTVGERAYVTVGAVITRDVPPEHIAFGHNEMLDGRSEEAAAKFGKLAVSLARPGGFFDKGCG